MPSPPASANAQPKSNDPLPQRPGTNLPQTSGPPRSEEATIIRSFSNFGGLQRPRNPASSSPSLTGAGLGDTGARPGTNSASSLGGPGNGLRPSYSPFGSRDPPPAAGEYLIRDVVGADDRCPQIYDWKHATRTKTCYSRYRLSYDPAFTPGSTSPPSPSSSPPPSWYNSTYTSLDTCYRRNLHHTGDCQRITSQTRSPIQLRLSKYVWWVGIVRARFEGA
jgi:hypothetical protein